MKSGSREALLEGAKAPDARRAGTLFLLGGLLFLLLTTAAESIYPNYSVQNNAISDLAATSATTAGIEGTAVMGLGLCWTIGAYILFRKTGRKGTMALNLLPGVGYLLAGLSPENVNLAIHSLGALLAFPLGAVVAIQSYRVTGAPLRYFSVGLGGLSLIATFMIFFGYRVVGPCGTCGGSTSTYDQSLDKLALGLGGWEAMIVYPLLIWLVAFGSYLLSLQSLGRVA